MANAAVSWRLLGFVKSVYKRGSCRVAEVSVTSVEETLSDEPHPTSVYVEMIDDSVPLSSPVEVVKYVMQSEGIASSMITMRQLLESARPPAAEKSGVVVLSYEQRQLMSGLHAGCWVVVTRAAHDGELGWSGTWKPDMSDMVGEVSCIVGVHVGDKGILLLGNDNYFPCFVLKKAKTRAATMDDRGQLAVCGGHKANIVATYVDLDREMCVLGADGAKEPKVRPLSEVSVLCL